jgi:dolichol-phosphate mannosyltransferase
MIPASSRHDRLLLFIPCYNCAAQVPRVLERVRNVAHRFEEILVLDNGSRDGTLEAAAAAASTIRGTAVLVGRNRENYNLGGSHKAAFAHAVERGYSHVIVLHGDDQGDIADLLPVLDSGLHRRFDACLGSRFMSGARLEGYSALRTLGNRAFNALLTAGTLRHVSDLGSGLNVFAKSLFADPAIQRFADDLSFNVYLLLGAIDQGRRMIFFPISWREDDQISNVRIIRYGMRVLSIFRDFALRRPSFRSRDHRAVARSAYQFDVFARFPGSSS